MAEIRLYRKSLASDTFGSLPTADKLTFNAGTKDVENADLWTTYLHHGSPRGIAEHPNPNQNLSENQDTGLDEIVYEIDYACSRADLIGNQFMINLVSFKEGSQENVAELPNGRFSLEIDRNPNLNKISGNTIGLKIRDITFDMDEETPNLTTGTITLIESRDAV